MKNFTIILYGLLSIIITACTVKYTPPEVYTLSAEYVTHCTAIIGIEVNTEGTDRGNERGVVYSTSPGPTVEDNQSFVNSFT